MAEAEPTPVANPTIMDRQPHDNLQDTVELPSTRRNHIHDTVELAMLLQQLLLMLLPSRRYPRNVSVCSDSSNGILNNV